MPEGDSGLNTPPDPAKEWEKGERQFKQGLVVIVMIMVLGLAVIGLARYGFGALLGSGSDLGVFLAPFVLIFGIMAIIWLWFWFVKLVKAVK